MTAKKKITKKKITKKKITKKPTIPRKKMVITIAENSKGEINSEVDFEGVSRTDLLNLSALALATMVSAGVNEDATDTSIRILTAQSAVQAADTIIRQREGNKDA